MYDSQKLQKIINKSPKQYARNNQETKHESFTRCTQDLHCKNNLWATDVIKIEWAFCQYAHWRNCSRAFEWSWL